MLFARVFSKPVGDSLYRYVLERYPNTEYAKQAERNLGLKPTVQTEEDLAHKLFLDAEAARFGGGDIRSAVIPAYAKVVSAHPGTHEAAKAEFVIAMLYEENAHGDEKVAGSLDSAIDAFQTVRERYAGTPYGSVAETKLASAGIKPRPKTPVASPAPPAASAKLGARMGKDRMWSWVQNLGFGHKTGICLPGEEVGIVTPRKQWTVISECLSIAFGHNIAVTPLQLAMAHAAVANGGVWNPARLVKRI